MYFFERNMVGSDRSAQAVCQNTGRQDLSEAEKKAKLVSKKLDVAWSPQEAYYNMVWNAGERRSTVGRATECPVNVAGASLIY